MKHSYESRSNLGQRIARVVLSLMVFGLVLTGLGAPVQAQILFPRPPPATAPKASSSSSSSSVSAGKASHDKPSGVPEDPEIVPKDKGETQKIQPFGSNLFMGNFLRSREDGLNPNYQIMPGDHIALNIWGAVEQAGVYVVDGQGNIFLPQVGPVHLAGVKNSQLTNVVKEGLSRVYTRYFDVYTNLITAAPVAVFVTGGVARPGRYAGIPSDSVLFFLDQAGGINASLGSFRDISVIRDGETIQEIDLYDFILSGKLKDPQFQDGDTILVHHRRQVIELRGSVTAPSSLEFKDSPITGQQVLDVVAESAGATEVTVSGLRSGQPHSVTYPIAAFKLAELKHGDQVLLRDDGRSGTLLIHLEGEFEGSSIRAVKRGARLVDFLHHVKIDPALANTQGVHIRRASVAKAQKDSINEALFRLERTALLALSSSDSETNIRVKEADLVQRFVERAHLIQPLGRVVTSMNGQQLNVVLEEGDMVVLPPKTNIVRISGEVFMAQAVMYHSGMTAGDCVTASGGFSERADRGKLIIHHPNAEVQIADSDTPIFPGDEVLVVPRVDSKTTQNIMDVTQIIYQVAISAAFVLALFL